MPEPLKSRAMAMPVPQGHAGGPSCEDGPGVLAALEEGPSEDGWEQLRDPDAAEKLHLDGVGAGCFEHEGERAYFDDHGDDLGLGGFFGRG